MFRKILLSSFLAFSLFFFSASPVYAAWGQPCVARPEDTTPTPNPNNPNRPRFDDIATLTGFECAFANILMAVMAIAAIVLFVMFIIGGFKYLTSGGDAKAVEAAKKTLTYAIAGLVVLVLAVIILDLIHIITGVNVGIFKIYQP